MGFRLDAASGTLNARCMALRNDGVTDCRLDVESESSDAKYAVPGSSGDACSRVGAESVTPRAWPTGRDAARDAGSATHPNSGDGKRFLLTETDPWTLERGELDIRCLAVANESSKGRPGRPGRQLLEGLQLPRAAVPGLEFEQRSLERTGSVDTSRSCLTDGGSAMVASSSVSLGGGGLGNMSSWGESGASSRTARVDRCGVLEPG